MNSRKYTVDIEIEIWKKKSNNLKGVPFGIFFEIHSFPNKSKQIFEVVTSTTFLQLAAYADLMKSWYAHGQMKNE